MAVEENNSVLPPEIIEFILSKSTSKSLHLFKTVSKSWNILISDPVFRRSHLHQSRYSKSRNLFLRSFDSNNSHACFSLVKFEDRKFHTVQQQLKVPDNFTKILCFCDGVLVLSKSDSLYDRFMFWNPSTQKIYISPLKKFKPACSYGLCHDPTIGGFKFIIVYGMLYFVISCNGKRWTLTRKIMEHNMHGEMSSPVSVEGVVYWVKWHLDSRIIRYRITYFDPKDDKFKILQKPENVVETTKFYLVDLRGRLCLYCNGPGNNMYTVKIWMKGKGRGNSSWNELVTIENVETPIWWFKPLGIVENKILIRLASVAKTLLYNPFEKTFEQVEDLTFTELVPYMESLFFPDPII
ncbi:hypothetical protein MIMGU_mgv1a025657mg [Erythranthe guttata]|uniref:F-box domain-containing protein n=1 Tax=Erythranthe guttata TaxID=4155 RepID=A0A022QZ89_ERYGU|nr:PREDICTED: putative F-box protein At2g02030 [Erythranthe guttata]EYU32638.1 hypothetical protein MIMGU_mgv1a025657mg [Erythranthe guttata]|eukprot:XP_012843125.1 PREDICTED: putative F-box protein At2g02030 [Erythranthe guttata]